MKKFLTLILTALLGLSILGVSACGGKEGKITFYAPDGAPALAIAKFISDQEDFGTGATFEYNVVSSSSIGGIMTNGTADIMVMPVNAASKLYKANQSDPYKIASVITHGNLYIMSKESEAITDISSLKGKVVGVIGQGLVPDLTFKAVLGANQIEYQEGETAVEGKVVLRYFAEASYLLPMMKQGAITVGLLPEPAASKLSSMASEYSKVLDLQNLYNSQTESYPQAVLMIKTSLLNKYPNIISSMQTKFSANEDWVKNNTNSAVEAVNSTLVDGVTPSLSADNINASVVEGCNIYWQDAIVAKQEIEDYINKLIEINSSSANAITEDFYYSVNE